ncbi:MAG: hypothetical protein UU64_C0006G0014 [candidate division WWE3 bacterium GW2011_GWF2_41_45]|uniref:Glycosyltransferase RgtA/B/C/D-like domain-containing protein n=3 Tax=Katanobacteria TaxID=422282 RepID=A0A354G3F0_UNCKA|nr:MAG: hypothetical protein UU55_C0005G0013 [candidate division WWE3 bacterium GW2011_GWC2_41_23]KKS10263.1 MAG: hypothetical protein UU64_C0006G0014 [candidate division WWE3 bacterium GW2011_GWF2_41_45]KKS12229.1 MAG: hypothetical protein UU68_C0003G0013 [candidate division WWE3 bacterium GW2011_GWF1_41_53]KKS20005.1 MAG: hypothetical protein UU79_C0005G0013 [candidate division WWE3 bacterium GW2011_GWE1_41_72]KKS27338.1 MAG: hypothetical protein UU86_C0021G0013 [candidate division WWE3 bacte
MKPFWALGRDVILGRIRDSPFYGLVKSVPSLFLIIFFLALFFYLVNVPRDYQKNLETKTYRRLLTSYDITSNTFLPYEIIRNHKLSFGKETMAAMRAIEESKLPHSVIFAESKYVPSYPIVSGLMAVPVYFVPLVLGKIPNLDTVQRILGVLLLGRIAASFYTAISVGIFYLIIRKFSTTRKIKTGAWMYVFIFFFAFCTNVYSISSRGLWQHVSALLLNSLIILFLLYSNERKYLVKWLGLLCGLAFLARPTNVFFILPVALIVFLRFRSEFVKFVAMGAPIAIFYLSYNYLVFGSPITNEYIARNDTTFSTPVWVGLFGYMFSPARSFLFITPPLVLSYLGMWKLFKSRSRDYVDTILLYLSVAFLATLVMYSTWWCWYGADRFGYGFFTEWIPVLTLLTYPLAIKIKGIGRFILVLLIAYSFYTQFNAVIYRKSRCNMNHNWDFYCLKPGMFSEQEY